MLHNHFFKNRLIGEWFEMEDHEVINFIDTCKKLQNTIDFLLENNEFYN